MTFFARQEAARRRTYVLLLYYAVAVVLTVCAFYIILRGLAALLMNLLLLMSGERYSPDCAYMRVFVWNPVWVLMTSGVSAVFIVGGTIYRRISLTKGGAAVALSAGGREITPDRSLEFPERRLLNIVEEVALASGVPVPRVFVLDKERSINAFAAGFSLHDAAIAVTCGALERLSREELHGVIAHEFSHIKNGDMRLNSWLLSLLFGILSTSILGNFIMEDDSNDMVILGMVICLIGGVGVVFAQKIQALVSHQREFLADASAVQFTRNPAGLAGALKRIGASSHDNKMRCANRSELSHLLFSAGTPDEIFDSHPPLLERIQRLEPGFTGDFTPWSESPQEDAPVPATDATANPTSASTAPSEAAEIPTVAVVLPTLDPDLRETLVHPTMPPPRFCGCC